MKIINFDWNSFWIILPKQLNENQNEYLEKAKKCLDKFYRTYNTSEPIDIFWMIKGHLECLMEEGNFSEMDLEMNCDVKYKVRPDGIKDIPAGIWVYSHRIENRKPQVDFLKKKWTEFEYN
ncbi:MAG: hypothetical protein PHF86_12875 [Candidatus Nanoarchaeia archaeon]|nr:hypothetical protein [Candidatus Nanoarchaeia archaeon]